MRRAWLIVASATLVLSIGSTVSAQRPDFAGVWTRVVDSTTNARTVAATGDAAFRRGDPGIGWGSPLTITQQPNTIVVAYNAFGSYDMQPPVTLAFALDGSPTTNALMLGHSEAALTSTAAWRGDTLVVTTSYPAPPGTDAQRFTLRVRHALHLDASGQLVIGTTRDGIDGAPPTTARSSYNKR